jgi:hypothetical protein
MGAYAHVLWMAEPVMIRRMLGLQHQGFEILRRLRVGGVTLGRVTP